MKTVYMANLYVTLLQRRKKLQWPLVTLTFEIWSPKKICTIPGVCLTFVPKMKLIWLLVSEEFGHKQTDTQTEDLRLLYSPHDPLILAGVPSNLADSPPKSANIEGIRQIWRIPSKLTEIVPKSANFGGIMILFLDLSLKTKLGNYKHVLQVLQLSFRSKIVSIVKVNKINYIKKKGDGEISV